MTRRKKRPAAKKLKRNPLARALGSGVFRARVVPKPGVYKRRPKHPREDTDEA
jgi:hypothetical protein